MHIDQKNQKTKKYEFGKNAEKFVMITPEKVAVLLYDSNEILMIDLTTDKQKKIPIECKSSNVNIFPYPDSGLMCVQ